MARNGQHGLTANFKHGSMFEKIFEGEFVKPYIRNNFKSDISQNIE